jgi:dihydropyrimidinase
MTTAGSVAAVRAAQAAGHRVWGESCPKYLTLTNDDLIARGPVAKVGPPLRTRADNDALWAGIADSAIAVIASDHAPRDRVNVTHTDDIFEEPYGAPGTETLLPVVYDEMVVRRGLSLTQLAAVTSTNPAKIYGLYPKKGAISVGFDADLVFFDPDRPTVIHAADQHTTASYSLYEGRTVAGWPTHSFQRGRPLLVDGTLAASGGAGSYLPRQVSDLMQLAPGERFA